MQHSQFSKVEVKSIKPSCGSATADQMLLHRGNATATPSDVNKNKKNSAAAKGVIEAISVITGRLHSTRRHMW